MTTTRIPSINSPTEIREILGQLLPTDVQITETETKLSGPRTIAVYSDVEGQAQSICVCDVACANFLGAALTLISPAVATEDAESGKIGDAALDNLREALNVCVGLFSTAARISLSDVSVGDEKKQAEVETVGGGVGDTKTVEVDIERYGKGIMSLITFGKEEAE